MKRLLCYNLKDLYLPLTRVTLPEAEAHHAINVLRIKDGETVEAIDGEGLCLKVIIRISGKTAYLETAGSTPPAAKESTISTKLVLETAILKSDAMEWLVEKCVELDASAILPLITDHTVVRINAKGPDKFRDRWQKIADQALKQCGRLKRLEVHTPITLTALLSELPPTLQSTRLWCDEETCNKNDAPFIMDWLLDNKLGKNLDEIRLLIGPEGGWSTAEQKFLTNHSHDIHRISLGKTILRAETAGIFAVSVIIGCLINKRLPS